MESSEIMHVMDRFIRINDDMRDMFDAIMQLRLDLEAKVHELDKQFAQLAVTYKELTRRVDESVVVSRDIQRDFQANQQQFHAAIYDLSSRIGHSINIDARSNSSQSSNDTNMGNVGHVNGDLFSGDKVTEDGEEEENEEGEG